MAVSALGIAALFIWQGAIYTTPVVRTFGLTLLSDVCRDY